MKQLDIQMAAALKEQALKRKALDQADSEYRHAGKRLKAATQNSERFKPRVTEFWAARLIAGLLAEQRQSEADKARTQNIVDIIDTV